MTFGAGNVRNALALATVALAIASAVHAEIVERVMAVVAGDVITLADVTAAREFALVPTPAAPDPIADTLSRLIDRSLELGEVDRYAPPEPAVGDIDAALAAVRARFRSQAAFDHALAVVGMDEKYLRETLRQDLRIREYIAQRFTVPSASDDELSAYYTAHTAMFMENGQIEPLDQVRGRVAAAVVAERQESLVNTWVAGLRLRAEVTNLYSTTK